MMLDPPTPHTQWIRRLAVLHSSVVHAPHARYCICNITTIITIIITNTAQADLTCAHAGPELCGLPRVAAESPGEPPKTTTEATPPQPLLGEGCGWVTPATGPRTCEASLFYPIPRMSQRQELVSRLKQQDMTGRLWPWLAKLPRASVLVPLLLWNGEPHVLLTVRSEQLRTNKGEVCFPGGKQDPQDQDEIATALREAQEEIGLPPDQVEVVCQLVPIINMGGLMVTPVVGFVPSDFEPKPNPDEVSAIFHMPLAHFLSPINHSDRMFTTPGGNTFNIHYFTYQEAKSGEAEGPSYQIWGLTSIICIVAATIVLGRAPEFPVNFDVSNPQGFMEQYLNDRRIPNKL